MHYRLATIIGTSAFVFPEQAPWALFFALLSVISLVYRTSNFSRIIAILVAASFLVGVASGLLSASFVTAVLAAIVIARYNRLLALAVLALQSSYAASFEAIAANFLFTWHLEAAAPAILSAALFLIVQSRYTFLRITLVVLPLPIIWVAQKLGLTPYGLLISSGLPAIALAYITPIDERPALKGLSLFVVGGILMLAAIGWAMTPPRLPNAGYVVLLGEPGSPEAKFYSNYQEVLRFAGIPATTVKTIDNIPDESLVLLPWLTSSQPGEGAPSLERLRELALKRKWLVVMVGEHTDMGGVASKIKTITGQPFLRKDLSVPLGNTDESGQMRSADIRAWYPDAMLNRGASVEIMSPLNRILLSGDGWWSEPDIGEWLWVGDYLWQPQDRHGRLVMAMSADEGHTRWVVLGDTGPFINQQLVSDPRPAARIIELSSLWPMFLRDAGLVIITSVIALGFPFGIQLIVLTFVVLGSLLPFDSNNGPWRTLWRHESAFDERNFNQALVESSSLLTTDWKLVRARGPLSTNISLPEKPTVFFGLIAEKLMIGNTKLSNCKRLGSLPTDGVLLMDAQACKVEGDADILLGDIDEAAILKVGNVILVLDQNFLGQKAPSINRKWLEKVLAKYKS